MNEPSDRKRIVLADDNDELLCAVRALLSSDFEIEDAAQDGLALLAAVRRCKPDAVVSDIRMPGLNGLEACGRIVQEQLCGAVVLLTIHDEQCVVEDAMRAGIPGYVLKVDAADELIAAVQSVLIGRRYLSRGVRGYNEPSPAQSD